MELGIVKVMRFEAGDKWLVWFIFQEGYVGLVIDRNGDIEVPANAFFSWQDMFGNFGLS